MKITPFRPEFIQQAAGLFIRDFNQLHLMVPILPWTCADPQWVTESLETLFESCRGVAAMEGDRLVGYMGWFAIDNFRDTDRKAAYCPEWGHSVSHENTTAVYRAMYREAAAHWHEMKCSAHAITLLAHNQEVRNTWFWNGFGLHVVDAVRPLTPIEAPASPLTVRKATTEDLDQLVAIDAEHCAHYAQPPVLMVDRAGGSQAALEDFINQPKNSIWLALDGDTAAGYMIFEGSSFGASEVVNGERTIAVTGAYTRPVYRGQRGAVAILNAAMREYASQGYERCSVDFESFNPEAAAFWMKYFVPVCLSVVRVPEKVKS